EDDRGLDQVPGRPDRDLRERDEDCEHGRVGNERPEERLHPPHAVAILVRGARSVNCGRPRTRPPGRRPIRLVSPADQAPDTRAPKITPAIPSRMPKASDPRDRSEPPQSVGTKLPIVPPTAAHNQVTLRSMP